MAISGRFPPLLVNGKIPAFYATTKQDGKKTGTLSVPFALSGGATLADLARGQVTLRLKTLQEVVLINSITATKIEGNVATFIINDNIIQQLYIGEYLKVQIAAIGGSSGSVGYYSNVAITKFTTKPDVSLYNFSENTVNSFTSNLIGIYTQDVETGDITERVESYIFNLYNAPNEQGLIQSSGWKLHNSAIDDTTGTMAIFSTSTDSYDFISNLRSGLIYYTRYGVRTINGLEEYSPWYMVELNESGDLSFTADLIATNNFDDAYVSVTFDNILSFNISAVGTYLLSRSDDRDFQTWYELAIFTLHDPEDLEEWQYKDFLVEQGRTYKYSIQFFKNAVYTHRQISNFVTADFEDMFLYDGIRQLKIRYNPKVSSFKINHSEAKVETIGSQFPFFVRNGLIEYAEFPISGLISYQMDENEYFIPQKDIGLIHDDKQYRLRTQDTYFRQRDIPTSQLVGYNIFAERLFKREVLDWLGNGKEKVFKSPSEGNFIVRLMNISATPNDTLGRMLHTFSATAYETAEYDYKTVKNKQFLILS